MNLRAELAMVACALSVFISGALIGAGIALIAQATGTPTTSARIAGCTPAEACPVSP